MKYLKLFEDINSNYKETEGLIEDVFIEVFDKWGIKEFKAPGNNGFDLGDEYIMLRDLNTDEPYYSIKGSKLSNAEIGPNYKYRIVFSILQNVNNPSSVGRFEEIVRDCLSPLNRLKSFGINFEWDSNHIRNPFSDGIVDNFSMIKYFRLVALMK
jgi:hypothetical protein